MTKVTGTSKESAIKQINSIVSNLGKSTQKTTVKVTKCKKAMFETFKEVSDGFFIFQTADSYS